MGLPQIIDSISLTLDPDFLCNALRVKSGSDNAVRIAELVAEAEAVARPKAAYREVKMESFKEDSVVIDNIEFKSRLLMTNLNSASTLYAYVATCGNELDVWAKNYSDLLENFWTDTIMNFALGAAIGALENQLKPLCDDQHLSSMNPGSLEDWPITEQSPLFCILGTVPADIGITLTDSYLLLPLKTVSGIYFIAQEQFCNCQLCPRESCPGRRAPRIGDWTFLK
jgi:hypothetical protein